MRSNARRDRSGVRRNLKLRDARAKKGWGQEMLARKARVSAATINRAEIGRIVPTVVTQEKIARALGVPRDALFPDEEMLPWIERPQEQEASAR
jgi:transcriptional regulator with XRE-family HTH domain